MVRVAQLTDDQLKNVIDNPQLNTFLLEKNRVSILETLQARRNSYRLSDAHKSVSNCRCSVMRPAGDPEAGTLNRNPPIPFVKGDRRILVGCRSGRTRRGARLQRNC